MLTGHRGTHLPAGGRGQVGLTWEICGRPPQSAIWERGKLVSAKHHGRGLPPHATRLPSPGPVWPHSADTGHLPGGETPTPTPQGCSFPSISAWIGVFLTEMPDILLGPGYFPQFPENRRCEHPTAEAHAGPERAPGTIRPEARVHLTRKPPCGRAGGPAHTHSRRTFP